MLFINNIPRLKHKTIKFEEFVTKTILDVPINKIIFKNTIPTDG